MMRHLPPCVQIEGRKFEAEGLASLPLTLTPQAATQPTCPSPANNYTATQRTTANHPITCPVTRPVDRAPNPGGHDALTDAPALPFAHCPPAPSNSQLPPCSPASRPACQASPVLTWLLEATVKPFCLLFFHPHCPAPNLRPPHLSRGLCLRLRQCRHGCCKQAGGGYHQAPPFALCPPILPTSKPLPCLPVP